MRQLATIQIIKNVHPIEGADAIELVEFENIAWRCVSKKGEFKPGHHCVYFEIDSKLPEVPVFEFMRPRKHRVRTIKLRGQLSQGLALKPSEFPELTHQYIKEGDDVSEVLNVVKYEPPDPGGRNPLSGRSKPAGNFPGYLEKTDEPRCQSWTKLVEELLGKPYYITIKCDGSSGTYYINDEHFGVCSRNIEYKLPEEGEEKIGAFWTAARMYKIEEWLRACREYLGIDLCVQGEVCGPGIQKNWLRLADIGFFAFNFVDYKNGGRRLPYAEMVKLYAERKPAFQLVECIEVGTTFDYTIDQLLEKAEGKYRGTEEEREGIVIRHADNIRSTVKGCDWLSFKAISNKFLLKGGE